MQVSHYLITYKWISRRMTSSKVIKFWCFIFQKSWTLSMSKNKKTLDDYYIKNSGIKTKNKMHYVQSLAKKKKYIYIYIYICIYIFIFIYMWACKRNFRISNYTLSVSSKRIWEHLFPKPSDSIHKILSVQNIECPRAGKCKIRTSNK